MRISFLALVSILLVTLSVACSTEVEPPSEASASDASASGSEPPADPQTGTGSEPAISFGNGIANRIVTDGMTREGATFTFPEVQIDGNGWLVMHPFENGRPDGAIFVGSTYIEDGTSRDVSISVEGEPTSGTMFLVMLHLDVNENQEFDFVFVDKRNVLDKAVFEDTTMIAHAIAAP